MQQDKLNTNKCRPELRCISISNGVWEMVKELASKESESISAFIRYLIKKEYQRSKKKLEQIGVD